MAYEKRLKTKQETFDRKVCYWYVDSMSTRLQVVMKVKDGNTREHWFFM